MGPSGPVGPVDLQRIAVLLGSRLSDPHTLCLSAGLCHRFLLKKISLFRSLMLEMKDPSYWESQPELYVGLICMVTVMEL